MVYRLYRASRFLFFRIAVVLLIYALIIGVIGFLLLGLVVNFDRQSFNPELYDVNQLANDSNAPPICTIYKGEDCSWYSLQDLQGTPLIDKYTPQLKVIQERVNDRNLLLIQDKQTNLTLLTKASMSIGPGTYVNSSFFDFGVGPQLQDQNNNSMLCVTLVNGGSCENFPISQPSFKFIPNLQVYQNFTSGNTFLGSHALFPGNVSDGIVDPLCANFEGSCNYFRADNYTYTYIGPTQNNLKTNTNVTAYEALIQPYGSISPDLGNLPDTSLHRICVYDDGSCAGKYDSIGYIFPVLDAQSNGIRQGILNLDVITNSENDLYDYNSVQYSLSCFISDPSNALLTVNKEIPGQQMPISCSQLGSDNTATTKSLGYNNIAFPFENTGPSKPLIVFKLDNNGISLKPVLMITSQVKKPTMDILVNILSHPSTFLKSVFSNDVSSQLLQVCAVFFIVNLSLAIILIVFRLWKRIGGYLAPSSTLFLRGRVGRLLEMTQFFEFGGSWYLEAHGVYDYNFKSTFGVVHELVNERWRDTIFFPTSLAASISIVVFSLIPKPESLYSLIIFGGILPLLLMFWIPTLWTIEDSGLKRAEWSNSGELLAIQRISSIIRDGFNKLVGFGAIFGVGTAGASVARAGLQGSAVSSTSAITGGLENLLNFNWNFLVSAMLWTLALLFIVTSVSLTGNVLTSFSYLNTDHLTNVKKMRTKLQKKNIFLGTTQQAMDYAQADTSVYYDSQKGIDEAFATKRVKPMPSNKVISQENVASEEELTQIFITDSKNESKTQELSDSSYSQNKEISNDPESSQSQNEEISDDSDSYSLSEEIDQSESSSSQPDVEYGTEESSPSDSEDSSDQDTDKKDQS